MVKYTKTILLLAVITATVQVAYTFQCYTCDDCATVDETQLSECDLDHPEDQHHNCATEIIDGKINRKCVTAEASCDGPEIDQTATFCEICKTEKCNDKSGTNTLQSGIFLMVLCLAIGKIFYY